MIKTERLSGLAAEAPAEWDLVIVGGGPVGLTIASQLANTALRIVVLESGLMEETREHAALNTLESADLPETSAWIGKRTEFHGANAHFWSHDQQPFGVRCRGLGGSTHAWSGKSASFDPIDFEERPWVAHSGWPFGLDELEPYVERAKAELNLSRRDPPAKEKEQGGLRSFYWQFARSRITPLDIMRVGQEFVRKTAGNVRVIIDATATEVMVSADGARFTAVRAASLDGSEATFQARAVVLASGAIENARLLLASRGVASAGLGNDHGLVGRFLMDHLGARVGRFDRADIGPMQRRFNFVGLTDRGRTHMFMHGLALSPRVQRRNQLLNAAVYFMSERAPDDPWDALKRIIQRRSRGWAEDSRSVLAGAPLLLKGVGVKMLSSERMPAKLRAGVIDAAVRLNPSFVAEEYQSGGLPHKLTGLAIDAISEQRPDPDNRVTLAEQTDRWGVPLARVRWSVDEADARLLIRLARRVRERLAKAGLPTPRLEPWVERDRPDEGAIIDMAHTLGTTRMADEPRRGVVDRTGRVHGVRGLYVSGGSVFPTSGHANPTLMMLALAIRLADALKHELAGS